MKIRIRSRNTCLLWCGAHVLLGGLLGLMVFNPVVQAAPSACLKAEDEAKVRKDEVALLGEGHAAEHAQERVEKCALERRGGRRVATADAVTTSAVGAPADVGQWNMWNKPEEPAIPGATNSMPLPFGSVIGVHAVLLPTGNVMFWSTTTNNQLNDVRAYLWDPITNMRTDVTPQRQAIADNIWCGGQTLLHDGRLLVAGGNLAHPSGTTTYKGAKTLITFNPFNKTWAKQSVSMEKGRWYPTLTRLANNQVVITSGWTDDGTATMNPDVEVFTPAANIDSRHGTIQKVGEHDPTWFYPFQFLLRDGSMLQAGPTQSNSAILTRTVDTAGRVFWTWIARPVQGLRYNHCHYGNGILLPGGVNGSRKVMLIGGKDEKLGCNTKSFSASPSEPTSAFTEVLDTAASNPVWQPLASMPQPRARQNTVILPDGTLVTIGGNGLGHPFEQTQREALLYNPANNAWKSLASQQQERAYHSTALLLPSGEVLSAGDTRDGNPANHTLELFSPPYLYKGVRPVLLDVPHQAALGTKFQIRVDQAISKVVLMAPGATTHANDMHQRYAQLTIKPQANGWVRVTVPSLPSALCLYPDCNVVVPRGYYMLFALNANDVPSKAAWIKIF